MRDVETIRGIYYRDQLANLPIKAFVFHFLGSILYMSGRKELVACPAYHSGVCSFDFPDRAKLLS